MKVLRKRTRAMHLAIEIIVANTHCFPLFAAVEGGLPRSLKKRKSMKRSVSNTTVVTYRTLTGL